MDYEVFLLSRIREEYLRANRWLPRWIGRLLPGAPGVAAVPEAIN